MVRIFFRPVRAPKWWPRERGKPLFVGVVLDGYGWVKGIGDAIDAREVDSVKETIQFDFGPKTHFKVEAVA